MRLSVFILIVAALTRTSAAFADESPWDISGDIELQTRVFTENARWPGQSSLAGQFAIAARGEFRWYSNDGSRRASFIPYVRWDQVDPDRNLVDFREAFWAREGEATEILLGANTVFWGVAESVHLVDIINQTDLVADIDGEEKLGQPMLNWSLQQEWGQLGVFVLPYFRERTFPGISGRLRTPIPVDTDNVVYESSAREYHVDFALRYSHYFGDVDIGLSAFSGTSREPRFELAADGKSLVPHYDLIDQAGLDLQYTSEAWLWKLEAILRNGYSETFAAAVGGFEYTFYQVNDSSADVGLLLEYQYDGRNELEPISVNDNDIFLATRFAFNDTQDTAILAGLAVDMKTNEVFVNVEAKRRFGDNFLAEIRLRMLTGADPADVTYSFAKDDYIQIQVSRFF